MFCGAKERGLEEEIKDKFFLLTKALHLHKKSVHSAGVSKGTYQKKHQAAAQKYATAVSNHKQEIAGYNIRINEWRRKAASNGSRI